MPSKTPPKPLLTRESRRVRRIATATLAPALLFGGTACGPLTDTGDKASDGPFSGESGPDILNRSLRTIKTATSMTYDFAGTTSEGELKGRFAVNSRGECAGTLSMGATGTAELIKVGDTAWMRFDEAYLKELGKDESPADRAATIKVMKGRYIEADASDPDARESLELCDLNAMLANFEEESTAARVGGETTVNGRRALTLTETDGKVTYRAQVATEGKPYLLKAEQLGGDEPFMMAFSGFDEPVPVKKPARKDILDLEKLAQR
ncbi:hypothetical protein [Streptomyces albipurpureus]|uniref:Lipoprotein n=1 Tax=Streptomyces albipurpureus TaxID=2897419 RepID=A0ABT0UNP2_9ACTN|nr:hypothetical protein [Streptomyces sp. CWNU-1]MCM2390232.1 hypothetical protein [Streptomyces sp. CWNU-1]